jgi:hypothetical protein
MPDPFTRKIVSSIQRAEQLNDLKNFDRRSLSKMQDKDLAIWQSKYPAGSPQFILAEHEWQRRLTVEQIRGARFAAYIGILGALAGSIVTWLTAKW